MGLKHAWKLMLDLFDFKNLEQTIREEVPKGRGRYGIPNFGAGILLFLFSLFMLSVLAILYSGFMYDALSESYFVVTQKPELTYGFFISSAIYFGLLLFPYLFFGSFIYQALIYAIVRMMGGKGDFKKQYFITSYVALTLGVGTIGFIIASILGFFLPCLNLFFLLVYFVASIYLVFFAQARMLMILHRSSYIICATAILITSIGSVLAFIGVNYLIGHFGLLPDFTATFTIEGIENMSKIDIPNIDMANIVENTTNSTG